MKKTLIKTVSCCSLIVAALTLTSWAADNVMTKENGMTVINTTTLGKNVQGYIGTTPLKIYIEKNKVVKIDGATLEETSATAGKLTQGEVSIDVNNGASTANQQLCKITDWATDTKLENIAMVAILVAKSATANQLLPISIETSTVGITNVSSQKVADVEIYNLQGVRMSQLQKGINIVNGKKVVIK